MSVSAGLCIYVRKTTGGTEFDLPVCTRASAAACGSAPRPLSIRVQAQDSEQDEHAASEGDGVAAALRWVACWAFLPCRLNAHTYVYCAWPCRWHRAANFDSISPPRNSVRLQFSGDGNGNFEFHILLHYSAP